MSRSRSYHSSRRPVQSSSEALTTFEDSGEGDDLNEIERDPAFPGRRLVFYTSPRDERELYADNRFGGLVDWELERFLAYVTNEARYAFQKAA